MLARPYNDFSEENTLARKSIDTHPGDVHSSHELKEAAFTAIALLRAHGKASIDRNLAAGASLAALKAGLRHGEFGRFCIEELKISATYGARLLRLHRDREHLSEALAWAETQNHPLAECQSTQNLIMVIDDWRNRNKPAKPKSDSRTKRAKRGEEIIAEQELQIAEAAALIKDRDKAIAEQRFEIATRDHAIADLRRRLADCESDFVALRDDLSDEVRQQALIALTTNQGAALSKIAKRYHWRVQDLRRELENCTAV